MAKENISATRSLSKTQLLWLIGISVLFVVANLFFISLRVYFFNLVPVGLLLIVLSVLSLEKIFFIIVFLTPLSIQLKELWPGLSMNLYLPTEPLLFLVLLIFIVKLFREQSYPKEVLRHPVSLAIYFYLIWIFITSISSSLPVVSLKFFLTRLWFITGFYFLAILIFREPKKIVYFILTYGAGLLIVVLYALFNLSQEGFVNQLAAHSAPNPFFSDHTSYGAILALMLPPVIAIALKTKLSVTTRFIIWMLASVFTIALVFSYSRAAWLSVIAALGVFTLIKLKVRPGMLLMISILSSMIFIFYLPEITLKLEENRQDSSTDFSKHIQSISNVSSDASNLERINRWTSALRMFREKPLLGWGPGTYMFQYAGFQSSYDRTIISTNFGDRGNAHSEYIGPMAESGVLGAISIVLIIVASITTGLRYYRRKELSGYSWIALSVSLGLITYVLHGFLNNFLDTDKASALFWGFISIIVALDIYQSGETIETLS